MAAARNTSESTFYLTKVEDRYAGREPVVELWDVGDITGGPGSDEFSIFIGTDPTPPD